MKNLNRIFLSLCFVVFYFSIFAQQVEKFENCLCLNKLKPIKTYDIRKIDKKPEFPGGDAELLKYVAINLKCPVGDIEEMQTKIYAKFIIDTSGKVSKACIIRPLYGNRLTEIEKEFLRVLLAMPKWKPGEHKGKKATVWFIFPLHLTYR
jgi:periplasmic protein TonB